MTTEEMPWQIIDAMFRHRSDHLVAHHIDSYNRFARDGLREVIRHNNPLTVVRDHDPDLDDYRYRCEVFIGGRDGSLLQFHKPTYMDQGTQKPLYPNIARLRNASYAVYITHTAEVRIVTHPPGGERKEEWQRFEDIGLMWLPIMIGAEHCYLQNLPRSMRAAYGEGRNDPGGYFIIDGKEKAIVPQETFANNMLNIRELNSDEYSYAVDIRSISADPSKPQRNLSIRMVKGTSKQEGGQIVIKLPNVKQPMPIFTVMRALGLTSDREIVEAILGVGPEYSRYQRVLIPSIHDAGRIYTPETAQAFIGMFTKGKGRTHALEILTDYLLPHMGEDNFREKALFLGYMVLRMLRVYSGADQDTDRDSFAMKRVELSGDLLFDLAREYYKLDAKTITTRIDKEFYYHESVYKDNLAALVRNNVKAFFSDRILDNGVRKAFKGSWGAQAHTKKDGVVQALNRLSFNSAISQLRKLNLPLEASAKVIGPRLLHATQWGYIDPVDTPDGGNVGLHKHLAISTMISPGSSSEPLMRAVSAHGLIRLHHATPVQRANLTKIFLDGYWLGFVQEPEELIRRLHLLRLNNLIDTLTSCSYNRLQNEVHLLVSPGRLTRPILAVHDGRPIFTHSAQAKLIDSGKATWTELTKGLATKTDGTPEATPSASDSQLLGSAAPLAYIDAQETNTMLLAMSPAEFMPRNNGIEIHPSLIFGVMGNQIVYPENNQLPRDLFFCGQGKQAVSIYSTAYESRIDKSALVLHYGQIPLVKSRYLDYINHEENPYGVNAIVAIMSYSGYNVEDAVLINRGSIERGMFATTYYSMYESREESEKVAGTTISSQFMNTDDPTVLSRKAGYDYSGLDASGFLPVNTPIVEKQIVIGKAASNVQMPGEFMDQSVGTKKGAKGIVDRVYMSEGDDGFRVGKMRVREWRQPAQGDKVCSRCGQKGTVGLIVDEADMPFTESGIRPDIIVNPHALPSRMTIGQLVEALAAMVGAEYGTFGDCTAFENKGQKVTELGELLAKKGFSATGNAAMYAGQSGERIESQIYLGPTYYMRLKHMTKDKINHRGRGPRTKLTRQPVQGRANDGGLRIGEMERDGLLGHGMTNMLQQSMMERSDAFRLAVCNHSGTIAVYNEARDVFLSPYQDGPLVFERSEDNSVNNASVQRHGTSFSIIHVPYSFKLLWQELQALNIAMYVITDKNVDQLTRRPEREAEEEMKQMSKRLIQRLKQTGDIQQRGRRQRRGQDEERWRATFGEPPDAAPGASEYYGALGQYDTQPSVAAPQAAQDMSHGKWPPGLSKQYDPDTQRIYYYNHVTGETTWFPPEDPTKWPVPPPPEGSPFDTDVSTMGGNWQVITDPTTGKTVYRDDVNEITQELHPNHPDAPPEGWVKATDPETGNEYYVNPEHSLTQWTNPKQANLHVLWREAVDPKTGQRYYYGKNTKGQWRRPVDGWATDVPGWYAFTHGSKLFYQNQITGETQDQPPAPEKATQAAPIRPPDVYDPNAPKTPSPAYAPTSPAYAPTSPPGMAPRSPSATPPPLASPRFSPKSPTVAPGSPKMAPPRDTASAALAAPPQAYGPGTDYNPTSPTDFTTDAYAGVVPSSPSSDPESPSFSLPAGWQAVTDPKSGRTYYSNRELGRVQWGRPTTPAQGTPPDLPSGWRQLPGRPATTYTDVDGNEVNVAAWPPSYHHVPTGVVQGATPTQSPQGVPPLPPFNPPSTPSPPRVTAAAPAAAPAAPTPTPRPRPRGAIQFVSAGTLPGSKPGK